MRTMSILPDSPQNLVFPYDITRKQPQAKRLKAALSGVLTTLDLAIRYDSQSPVVEQPPQSAEGARLSIPWAWRSVIDDLEHLMASVERGSLELEESDARPSVETYHRAKDLIPQLAELRLPTPEISNGEGGSVLFYWRLERWVIEVEVIETTVHGAVVSVDGSSPYTKGSFDSLGQRIGQLCLPAEVEVS